MNSLPKCLLIMICAAFILTSCDGNTGAEDVASASSAEITNTAASTGASAVISPAPLVQQDSVKPSGTAAVDIFDVDRWQHPTKEILKKFDVIIKKMELLKDGTYPVFYVEFPKELSKENVDYFKSLVNELAKANGYWSYQLKDEKNSNIIEAECIPKNKEVISISVNGEKGYLEKLEGNSNGGQTAEKPLKMVKIDRKASGLAQITPLDFDRYSINDRIRQLLYGSGKYEAADYKNGIVQSLGYIICERFKERIIQDIKIGSDIAYVRKVLGKPSIVDKDFFLYKTRDFYLGFKGSSKVEYAIYEKRSSGCEKNILKIIIEQLHSSNDGLMEAISESNNLNKFFDDNGHIHGGGWYANSGCGISVVDFDESTLTVYNNFEGELYKAENFGYDIVFDNSDYEAKRAILSVNSYIENEREFAEEGVLSPSGKLKCTFFWGNSDTHFFTIKTLDNSRPDFTAGAPAGDFVWLNDSYILYMNAWTTAPYIVNVSDDKVYDDINVMYKLGIFEKDDYFQDFSFGYSLKGVKDNIITLYDEESKKEYKISYFIENNNIRLKLAK